jgi:hypothetical protein
MKKTFLCLSAIIAMTMWACGGDGPDPDPDNGDNTGGATDTEAAVGKTLPLWSEGYLDIHLINTGRGECNFLILPDGTTFLIDAGELGDLSSTTNQVPQRPNSRVRPYLTYAQYIQHFLPTGHTAIDWCMPSHLHIDHIGGPSASTTKSSAGYTLVGMMALYDKVPYKNVVDMGYPTYDEDTTIPAMDGDLSGDWETFVKWQVANSGMNAARFEVGTEQFTLQYDKETYPNFKIFNIVGNGYAWVSGSVVNTNATAGNSSSLGIHLSYGNFDFIACGDLTGAPQNRMATYYRDYIGKGKLEVYKAQHHLASNSWGSKMQEYEFNPRVIVAHTMYDTQPDPTLLTSIFSGVFTNNTYQWEKSVFCTNLSTNYVSTQPELAQQCEGYNGHIVVRVAPGGGEYYVYLLDDTNYEYNVKAIYGPYTSI